MISPRPQMPHVHEGIVATFVQLFLSQVSAVMASSLPLASGRRDETPQKEDAMEQPQGRSRPARTNADAGNAPRPVREQSQKSTAKGEHQNESNTREGSAAKIVFLTE
jgi:hypothetical protein